MRSQKSVAAGWFERIPDTWKTVRLKRAAMSVIERRMVVSTDRYIGLEHIEPWTGRITESNTAVDVDGLGACFRKGDVLFGKLRPYLAKSYRAANDGIGTTELLVLRGTQVAPAFLQWCLLTPAFVESVSATTYGAKMPRASWDDIGSLWLPVPPAPEQERVVAFLDRETAKIDALIAKQTEFLTRLDEHRRALITEAVTGGLDPTVPMQDTGLAVFSYIPMHWSAKPLKALIRHGTSLTYGIVQAGPNVPNGVPYIRTSDMGGDKLPEGEYLRTTPEIAAAYGRSRVQAGDLVIAIRATVGKTLPVPQWLDGANLTQGTAKIALGDLMLAEYLLFVLNSDGASQGFDAISKGATFKEITLEMLRKFRVPVPPIQEQVAITRYLASRLTQLDATYDRSVRMIALLRERRAALITAAVTGQIDITAPGLTEEAA